MEWIWIIRKIVRYFSASPEISRMETLMETMGKKSIFSPLELPIVFHSRNSVTVSDILNDVMLNLLKSNQDTVTIVFNFDTINSKP